MMARPVDESSDSDDEEEDSESDSEDEGDEASEEAEPKHLGFPEALARALEGPQKGKVALTPGQTDALRNVYWRIERPLRGLTMAISNMSSCDDPLNLTEKEQETLRALLDKKEVMTEAEKKSLQNKIDELSDKKLSLVTVGGKLLHHFVP
jgi:hypothetical protein